MSFLCSIKTFKSAVEECISLLTKENLSARGIEEALNNQDLEKLRGFLSWTVSKIDKGVNSYEKLVEELQKPEVPVEYKSLAGFSGKILDAVQIMKPGTLRSQEINKTIKEALMRTGHAFAWEDVSNDERKKYTKELARATATFHLLEVAFTKYKTAGKKNPIATLRMSMGGRLPEEYFAELLAGWFVEDLIRSEVEKKGLTARLTGVDQERKVLFVRPNNMGNYDLRVKMDDKKSYLLEIQRVGSLTETRVESSTETKKKFLKVSLKHHKYEGGSGNDKVLVLWIGKEPTKIAKKHKGLFNHLIFIANVKSRGEAEVKFKDETIFVEKSLVNKNNLSWADFKEYDKEKLVEFFKKLTTTS